MLRHQMYFFFGELNTSATDVIKLFNSHIHLTEVIFTSKEICSSVF